MHLRFIVGLVIGLIALAVGFACLGVTLTFTYDTIYQVGSGWAVQMATAASNSVKYYLDNRVEATLAGAAKAGRCYTPRVGSDLAKIDGKNWTEFWKVQMMQAGSKYGYDFVAYGMFMEDLNWMFVARSGVAPSEAVRIEWIEPKVPYDASGGATFGGYRYFIGNGSEFPYDNRTTGYQTEFFALDGGNVFHQASPGFSVVRQSLRARIGVTDPPMFAAPLDATYIKATNSFFIWSFVAGIVNNSGSLIGILAMSLGLESTITGVLTNTPHSRGGYNFLSDSQGYLIGSTHPVPFVNITTTTLTAIAPNPGCSNTASLNPGIQPPRMNCRAFYANFPYPPLQQLLRSEALTNSLTSTTVRTDDGDDYIVVTNRITTNTAREKIQIFSVVPVSDLLGSVGRGRDVAIGVAATIMVTTIAIAVGIMSAILQPLEDVSEKMISMARLEGLEPVDKMNMNDEEKNNNNNSNEHGDGERILSLQEQEDIDDAKVKKLSTLSKNNKSAQKNRKSQITSDERGDDDPLNTTTTNVNHANILNSSNDDNNNGNLSWISEIANLQRSYTEAKTAMTNFTRYVSRAVVSELLIQRRMASQGESAPKLPARRSGAEATAAAARNLATLDEQEVAPTTFNFDYDVTVLISEIEGFSQLWGANSTPDQHDVVLYVLHIYFKRMTRLVMGHGGVVDKFMGDSIMSYWGAPVRTEHHALLAVLCSLSLLRESRRDPLKKLFGETLRRPLRLRSGVSTGAAFVGTVGSAQSVSYSVIGRPVSTAKHLQDFTRYWNASILMDSATMLKVDDTIVHRLLCAAIFEEGAKPVTAYEVVGLNPEGKLLHERVTSKRMAMTASSGAVASTEMLKSDGSLVSLPSAVDGTAQQQPSQQQASQQSAQNRIHPSAEPSNNNDHSSTTNQSSGNLVSHSSCSSAATTQQQDFGETVAFTDVLSVATLGSNEGVEELLRAMNPDQSSLDNLLRWHSTRCVVTTPGHIYFAEQYSECARLCIECKFAASMELWRAMAADEATIPKDRRKDVSMDILATMNRLYLTSPPPRESLSEEDGTFVIRVYRFQALMAQDRSNKRAKGTSSSSGCGNDGNGDRRKSSSNNNNNNNNSRKTNPFNSQQQSQHNNNNSRSSSGSSQKNTAVQQQQNQENNQVNYNDNLANGKNTPSSEGGYTDLMVRSSKNNNNGNIENDNDRTSRNSTLSHDKPQLQQQQPVQVLTMNTSHENHHNNHSHTNNSSGAYVGSMNQVTVNAVPIPAVSLNTINKNESGNASTDVVHQNSNNILSHNNNTNADDDVGIVHRTAQNDITSATATHYYSENHNCSHSNSRNNNNHNNNNNAVGTSSTHVVIEGGARDLSMTSNNIPHPNDMDISFHKPQ